MPIRMPMTQRPNPMATFALVRALSFVLALLPLPPALARAAAAPGDGSGMAAAPLVMLDAGVRGPVAFVGSAGPRALVPLAFSPFTTARPAAMERVAAPTFRPQRSGTHLATLGRLQLEGG
ncbi:MAG: hypothetical protein R6W77_16910 [Trueperaceae bacterium]